MNNYNSTHQESIRPFQAILPYLLKIIEQIKVYDQENVKLLLKVARYFVETDNQLQKGRFYLVQAKKGTFRYCSDPARTSFYPNLYYMMNNFSFRKLLDKFISLY